MDAQAERLVRAWFPSFRPTRQGRGFREFFTFFREYNRFLNRGASSGRRAFDDKLLFSGFLAGIGIRTPVTRWIVLRHTAVSVEGECIPTSELPARLGKDPWFVKPRLGEGGHGAFLLQDGTVTTAEGHTEPAHPAFLLKLFDSGDGFLVQDVVVQSSDYAAFSPSSLNTVRCLTYLCRNGGG